MRAPEATAIRALHELAAHQLVDSNAGDSGQLRAANQWCIEAKTLRLWRSLFMVDK